MGPVSVPRGEFTQYVYDYLSGELDYPVGDNEPPVAPHGWQGEPNADGSNFIPWVTLVPGTATVSSGSFDASQQDWRIAYMLGSSATSRKQLENIADLVRRKIVNIQRQKILTTEGTWAILQARVTGISAVTRIGQLNPAYFTQTDTVELWLSRDIG